MNEYEWSVIVMGLVITNLALTGGLVTLVIVMIFRWPKRDDRLASDLVRNLSETWASGHAAGRNEAQNSLLPGASGVASALGRESVPDFDPDPEDVDRPVDVSTH